MSYTRFAIYYLPPAGPLAAFGASWLGWDVESGAPVDHWDVPGIDDVTMTPRKYGFHGTLKPPFRLADGRSPEGLAEAVAAMAAACAPARAEGLALTALGRFLALTPVGDVSGVARVAATSVRDLDAFRAPAPEAELERRRKAGLSERQEANLQAWGYPYVMEDFRFHLTLTGRLPKPELPAWMAEASGLLPDLPAPFVLDAVALVGERSDGRFELIQRYALTG
ncbi:DUF1045 domain-containing protein [Mesobacterium pallidum]|uniref:DUF1045 domain-containing protein n=1 Tax=Mesobacterium pallidum TaxID=2872037 RepID=UPI001EE1982A|nr:DUF1045 domain-containing protein [Mesobacterium pallidum]